MKIAKVGKEIKPGHYKAFYVSQPLEGDDKKMRSRYNIEQNILEGDAIYDIYDMFADLANAFNELKSGITDGPAMNKWDNRQAQIKSILSGK